MPHVSDLYVGHSFRPTFLAHRVNPDEPSFPSFVKEKLHIDDSFTLAEDRWFLSVPLNSFAGLLRPLR